VERRFDPFKEVSVGDIADVNGLTRWHLVRMPRKQSLSEHLGQIGLIFSFLEARLADRFNVQELAEGYQFCLTHDLPEIEATGDIPTNVKVALNQKGAGHIIGELENDFWRRRGLDEGEPLFGGRVKALVKLSDRVDATFFYLVEGGPDVGIQDILIAESERFCLQEFPELLEHVKKFWIYARTYKMCPYRWNANASDELAAANKKAVLCIK
jgi:hypothetical protein